MKGSILKGKSKMVLIAICSLMIAHMFSAIKVDAAPSFYFYDKAGYTRPSGYVSWDTYVNNINRFWWKGIDSSQVTWRVRTSTDGGTTFGSWSTYQTGSYTFNEKPSTAGNHRIVRQIQVKGHGTYKSNVAYVDMLPPTITANTSSRAWGNTNASVTLTYTDTGMGISTKQYRWTTSTTTPTSGWSNYSSAVTQSSNGTWYLHVKATDKAGLTTTKRFGPYRIDKTAPTITFSTNSRGWSSSNASTSVSITDSGGSGYKQHRYRVETNGSWGSWSGWSTSSTRNLSWSTNGSRRVQIQAQDNAGNSQTSTSGYFRIDKTAPTGTISPTSRGWGNTNVSVGYTPSDSGGSGFYRWQYRIETNGTWGSWTGWNWSGASSFTLSSNGTYRVQFQGKDNAGNTNTVTSGYYYIDKTAPTHQNHSLTGYTYKNGNDYWVRPNTQVSIRMRGYDALSGMRYNYIKLLGSGVDARSNHDWNGTATHNNHWMTSNQVSIDTASRTYNSSGHREITWKVTPKNYVNTYDIQYYYTDVAGNTRGYTSTGMRLRVDNAAPSGTITETVNQSSTTLSISATDAGSGVNRIQKPNGTWVNGASTTHTVTANGTYSFIVEDNVGYTKTVSYTVTSIDTEPPSAGVAQNPTNWTKGPVDITVSAGDNFSGVKSIEMIGGKNGAANLLVGGGGGFRAHSNNGEVYPIEYQNMGTYSRLRRTYPAGITNEALSPYTTTFFTAPESGTYTYSIQVKPNNYDINLGPWFVGQGATVTAKANQWTTLTRTVELAAGSQERILLFYGTMPKDKIQWIDYRNITITKGEEAPPYSPAPSEVKLQNKNLLKDGNIARSTSDYMVAMYEMNEPLIEGQKYTMTLKGHKLASQDFGLWQNQATTKRGNLVHKGNDIYQLTFTAVAPLEGRAAIDNSRVRIYQPSSDTRGPASIEWAMLEKGSTSSPLTEPNKNLLAGGNVPHSNNDYNTAMYIPIHDLVPGQKYTISIDVTPGKGVTHLAPYVSEGYRSFGDFEVNGTGRQTITKTITASYADGKTPADNRAYARVRFYRFPKDGVVTSNTTIHRVKIEEGSTATPWSLAPHEVTHIAKYSVMKNGKYDFRVTDNNNNITNISHTVTNIDDIKPSGTITKSTNDWTNKDVTLTFNATDGQSGVKRVKGPDGIWVNGSSVSHTATTNGTYTFRVEDNVGNYKDVSITVDNIDKEIPDGEITGNPTDWTNQNITLTFNATDTGGSGVRRVRVKDGTWVNGATTTQVVTQNGTYAFEVEDNAGNTRTVSTEVTYIDKLDPILDIEGSYYNYSDDKLIIDLDGTKDAEATSQYGKSEVDWSTAKVIIKNAGGIVVKQENLINGTNTIELNEVFDEIPDKFSYEVVIKDKAGNSKYSGENSIKPLLIKEIRVERLLTDLLTEDGLQQFKAGETGRLVLKTQSADKIEIEYPIITVIPNGEDEQKEFKVLYKRVGTDNYSDVTIEDVTGDDSTLFQVGLYNIPANEYTIKVKIYRGEYNKSDEVTVRILSSEELDSEMERSQSILDQLRTKLR